MKSKQLGPSRRDIFRQSVAAAAGAMAAAPFLRAAPAQAAKVTKAAASYQDHPHSGEKCAFCAHYIPGTTAAANGACQLVEGSISPNGWCTLFLGVH
jgi:hypothetical protein